MQEIKPYSSHLSKKKQVEEMFNNVASTYDKVNRVLSFYIDVYWRKVLLNSLNQQNPKKILDVATGTGDLALALANKRNSEVIGYDLSEKMLEIAQIKALKRRSKNLLFMHGDAEKMPFEDNQFDAITVAFGIRNFENLEKGLQEMFRILQPNGILYILEFSQPTNHIFKSIYFFYFTKILPFIGGILSKDRRAYAYLPNSVYNFPFGKQMLSLLNKNKFKETQFKSLTFGIASIYIAKK